MFRSPTYLPLHLDPLQPLSCYCLWRVPPTFPPEQGPPFSSPWFLRSLPFWHQLTRVLLSFLRPTRLVDPLVIFLTFMPSAPKSYLLLRIPLKGGDNLMVDVADVPGSYQREVAKGIKHRVHVCAAPGRKESFVDYTLVPGPATYIYADKRVIC